ncbi:MAG TPA: multiheme c-type cytochrome, partial [Gemmataceae bacterium]|nr:multiheme c-type cytochrome [Gemmataceae bacterium]
MGLILAGIAVVCIWAWPNRKPAVAPAHGPDDEWPDPVVANPGYLGPDACVACHAERVAEFRRTNHYHACRRPEDSPMPPGFTQGRGAVPTDMPGLHFEMTRSGDSFVHTSVNAAPTGEQRLTDRISLAFGAGGLDEVYFAWRGDLLYELPVAWLHPLDRWGHNPLRKYYSGDYARTGTGRCQECHNTWFEQIPGSVNRYRPESFILGVTCERCHGPGREHVAFHQAHPRADSTHAIINPARLSRERLLEVCTQCHSNAVGSRGPRFAYRPGEPLADYFRILETRHPEDDHVANQVTYLRQSKCFQRSDTLTCTTCHNPHRQTDHAAVRRSCLSCHEPAACRERPRVPAAVRDDCAGCHMPPRVW